MTISFDLEWTKEKIVDVLGLAWDGGTMCSAVDRNDQTMGQFLEVLHKADRLAAQNGIDADLAQLRREGFDVSALLPKTFDIRLAFHVVNSHLAGSGSYDLRSIVLLLGGRQGQRFPLDFKQYASDLHRTCALDACAVSWAVPTLDRLIRQHHVEQTVEISHQCADIFSRMGEQGVRLDPRVLEQIHTARKAKTEQIIEQYHLWEERGKKVLKRVPIWRSNKILNICEQQFGIRPKDRQRATWAKLAAGPLAPDARAFIEAVIDLGKGANDAHWLGNAEEDGDGLSFDKVDEAGFIYPRYDLCGSPDRAIASSPNIQNFPRPSDDPRPVPLRKAIIPLDESHSLLGVDFSSVETITNAYESQDMDRVQATLDKRITHEGTAALINKTFGLNLNRSQGKVVNHSTDKGESPYNLARMLFKTDRPSRQQVLQCQQVSATMLADYPKTAKFRDNLWERARDNPLIVTNSFGRRLLCFSRSKYGEAGESRFARHDPSKKYWCSCGECSPRRDRWKYAIAFLGRSAAFDALLRAMARIWHEKRLDTFSLPVIECHDELDFSVPTERVMHYAEIVKRTFEEPIPELGGISLPASAVWGASWAAAH